MEPRQGSERRAATRYNLRLPAELHWVAEGRNAKADTLTRDVSTAGLFVESMADLPVGTAVNVSVSVPPPKAAVSTIQLQGAGVVVRRGGIAEAPGFAIAIKLELPLKTSGESDSL